MSNKWANTNNKVPDLLCLVFMAIMITINVICIFYSIRQKRIMDDNESASSIKIDELHSSNVKLRGMVLNNIWSESSVLNPDLLLKNINTKEEKRLVQILDDGPTLVLRFTEYSCEVCVENALKTMRQLSYPVTPERFIIIVSYESVRSLLLFRQENKIKYSIYILMNDRLSIPLESLNFPYFFIVNGNLTATNIFYPLTSMPELTGEYFKILHDKFPQLFDN